jgi:hypothetical protein
MRLRLLLAVLGITAVMACSVPAASAAQPPSAKPTLTLQPWCPVQNGRQVYGVTASLSGLPPNTTFQGTVQLDGTAATGSLVTDSLGNFGPVQVGQIGVPVAVITVTVVWAGGQLVQTLSRPCQAPTSKAQCKSGGYAASGTFKNQGACVSFFATNGRSQPG